MSCLVSWHYREVKYEKDVDQLSVCTCDFLQDSCRIPRKSSKDLTWNLWEPDKLKQGNNDNNIIGVIQ